MKEIVLRRLYDNGRYTIGLLLYGVPFALTLEQTYRSNKPDDPNTPENDSSCIPPGRYVCKKVMSPKFGATFEVFGVPGRTAILFHGGDSVKASLGCILTGMSFGGTFENILDGCAEALKKLFALVGTDKEFTLKVEAPPE